MTERMGADVRLIHIAGGAPRTTPPAGTRVQAPPRRAARGRSEDLFFVTLRLQGASGRAPTLLDPLARLACDTYFDRSGSVTGALRDAVGAVNQHILDANESESDASRLHGHLLAAALRGKELIVAQSGFGQTILVRDGEITRLASDEASDRPLGQSVAPHIRYHHFQVNEKDILLLTSAAPPLWSDPALATLAGLAADQAVERLGAGEEREIAGVLLRIVPQGEASALPAPAISAPMPRSPAAVRPEVPPRPAGRRGRRDKPRAPAPAPPAASAALQRLAGAWEPVAARLRQAGEGGAHALTRLLYRLAPGLAEAPSPGEFPPTLLAATAVAVPLVIVAIASAVYFQRGRAEQFQAYLDEAQTSIATAQAAQDPAQAREAWGAALALLDQAERYGAASEAEDLRQQVLAAIDALDIVERLDFRPVISGGFGAGTQISMMAATATDLYLLDPSREALWRAWATGRGYEIDETFECLGQSATMGDPVDLAAQPEPGALGAEGVVAVDADGSLLYCAPEKSPASGQLSEPDTGFGRVQAIDVFENRLYVLDPERNAVWLYDASGGLFSGNPELYFAEDVPDLNNAVDLAATQDELFILYADGSLNRCRRVVEATQGGGVHIRSDCERGVSFEDERPGFVASDHIPGGLPIRLLYSPPPEPSLFFLDVITGGVYQYSMRLVYQAQYRPQTPFPKPVSALTVGPPNELFVAAGDQVYYAQSTR